MSLEAEIATSSESPPAEAVHESIREEIYELATRHELGESAADRLLGLVRLADWRQPNFVPKPDPIRSLKNPKPRTDAMQRRTALNMLAESLSGLELEPVRIAQRLADIGSGAGFPGLVLAIALPQARVTLIEKVEETSRFLRRAVAELELDNVEVEERHVQGWSEGVGTCDVVTSRRAGRPKTIVEWSAPLLAPGGAIVLWQRGRRDQAKERVAAEAAEAAGLRFAHAHRSEYRHEKRVHVNHLYLYLKAEQS